MQILGGHNSQGKIVLEVYSGALKNFDEDQIVSAICHEMGHILGKLTLNDAGIHGRVISVDAVEGEADYFRRFPDVKHAVRVGSLASAFVHWELFGRKEGRRYRCLETMDDNENDYEEQDKGKEKRKGKGTAHRKQKKNQ